MKIQFNLLGAVLIAGLFFGGCFAERVPGAETRAAEKHLKVLTIGNSFSICLLKQLPACAKATPGVTLDLVSLYIGGCSLERHWKNIEKSDDASFRPYSLSWSYASVTVPGDAAVAKALNGRKTANIPETLTADKWDIVTIQQASPSSWNSETYYPYADKLIAKIRELAPQAEIRIQQTWSYCNADRRIYGPKGKNTWSFDQQGMYDRLTDAYTALGKKYGLKIIPTGYAVQLYRKELPVTFMPPSQEEMKAFVKPALPDMKGEVVGAYHWGKGRGKDTASKIRCDSIHLNREGEYLQACVWLSSLFGTDVTKLTYQPDFGPSFAARAPLLRACAQKAVTTFKKP